MFVIISRVMRLYLFTFGYQERGKRVGFDLIERIKRGRIRAVLQYVASQSLLYLVGLPMSFFWVGPIELDDVQGCQTRQVLAHRQSLAGPIFDMYRTDTITLFIGQ